MQYHLSWQSVPTVCSQQFLSFYFRIIIIPYQQEIKREHSEHLISPDMVTTESYSASARRLRSRRILELLYHILRCQYRKSFRENCKAILLAQIAESALIIPYPHKHKKQKIKGLLQNSELSVFACADTLSLLSIFSSILIFCPFLQDSFQLFKIAAPFFQRAIGLSERFVKGIMQNI